MFIRGLNLSTVEYMAKQEKFLDKGQRRSGNMSYVIFSYKNMSNNKKRRPNAATVRTFNNILTHLHTTPIYNEHNKHINKLVAL